MTQRKPTGARKKSVIDADTAITQYLNQSISHPMQSSFNGQLKVSHGNNRVSTQEARIASRHVTREKRKTKKLVWFLTPTQLLSQGQ